MNDIMKYATWNLGRLAHKKRKSTTFYMKDM